MMPRESAPFRDPDEFAYFPLPITTWLLQYGSFLFRSDQVLVERSKAAPPLAPQLARWNVTSNHDGPVPPDMSCTPITCPDIGVGQFGSFWTEPLIVLFWTSMN